MSKMKELYDKVAVDSALQAKFAEIMKEKDGTAEKLTAFAREAGYDVTIEEIKGYFKELAESGQGVLSDAELDKVAGGKGSEAFPGASLVLYVFNCTYNSVISEVNAKDNTSSCTTLWDALS